jgi:glycosyltransferase involved in cell wall biosynthesis/GT2 family glycosyltransferase
VTDSLRASVVVNTLDRADSLELLLRSLELQWHPEEFEVVVVTGPCTDHTDEVVERWGPRIKHRTCDEANLSLSRNIGIQAASGDVIVFVDDDAVPEPRWLSELLAPLEADPEVVASGGYVWDHTGYDLQCRFNRCDRLGRASFHSPHPLDGLCLPGAIEFPYVPGGNGAWRRGQLLDIGGFDENFEYYLDEVDVAVRAVDAGWKLAQVPGAAIHHKFLPSSLRAEGRVLRHRYSVLKNKALFGLFNGRAHHTLEEILGEAAKFTVDHRADVEQHVASGNLPAEALDDFDADAEAALTTALDVGLRKGRRLGWPGRGPDDGSAWVGFPVLRPDGGHRRYAFVSQAIPPDPVGGIGRYMMDVARGLGEQGHEVRVITDGVAHDTIDLENRVWVHRVVKPPVVGEVPPPEVGPVPARIWANAVRVRQEVERMLSEHSLDAVYSAVWDTEALAVEGTLPVPVVVALVTSLALAMESDPTWAREPGFIEDFVKPMREVERRFIEHADLVHAISGTILEAVERSSGISIEADRVRVSPLGVDDLLAGAARPEPRPEVTSILFVGRFEKRKGIDLLLAALAEVMPDRPDLHATLIGKSDLPGPDGQTWVQWMDSSLPNGEWRNRVHILGEVPDDELRAAYATADLFVAPSRFESFGLIYVEAMACSLPVIALAGGAAPEVIGEECGLLVAEDHHALAGAIAQLAADPGLRARMGEAGRARFEEHFTVEQMVEGVREILDGAAPVGDER